MPPFGSTPVSRSCGFLKKTVTFVPSFKFSFVVPLPRSHKARCSSSKTIVLPRGLTCAKPLGKTVATRHTWIGKAALMCSWRTFGILANWSPRGRPQNRLQLACRWQRECCESQPRGRDDPLAAIEHVGDRGGAPNGRTELEFPQLLPHGCV